MINLSILDILSIIEPMTTISATEAKQKFAALLDTALREPVRIQRHDRDVVMVVSIEDYERMQGSRENAVSPYPRATGSEFRAFLDRLASNTPNVSNLRNETFSRDMIYGDHD